MSRLAESFADATGALRLASDADIPALEALIPISVRALQAKHYSAAQMDAALGTVFGMDRALIRDRTYYVTEHAGQITACGGWSRRQALFGADAGRPAEDSILDPAVDAARVRAFFVHPDYARRGLGRMILTASEEAMRAAGFRSANVVATLTGEPLYAACGYAAVERFDIPLANGLGLPAVRMRKVFPAASPA
jgi:GNAT superfamily N-acetyltransferase